MVEPGLNPPPVFTTPQNLPWDDAKALIQRLDQLVNLLGGPSMGTSQQVSGLQVIRVPGAPGTTAQLIAIMQEMVPESIGNSAVIPFQKTIATAYQDEQARQVPFTGIIREVIMAFPAGCQQLVEVRMVYYPNTGGKSFIVPTIEDSFIALDDFTVVFNPRFPVQSPGRLEIEWWNYDSLNTHTVPVVAILTPTRLEID